MNKVLSVFLHIILGAVFIFSAVVKLYPIEPVELYVFSFGLFSWSVSEVLLRLLVGGEAFLGLMLLIQFQRKLILKIALAALSIMSLLLVYNIFFTDAENCFCFGDALPMTPTQSLLKNVLLIGLTSGLLFLPDSVKLPFKKIIVPVLAAGCLLYPFILSTPDSWFPERYAKKVQTDTFPSDKLPDEISAKIVEGKKILCFYSMKCKYCRMSAKKLSLIDDRLGNVLDIKYFFYGHAENMAQFWEKSKSNKYEYFIIDPLSFFNISDPGLPTIFLIEDGKVVEKLGYRTLTDYSIVDFWGEN